VDTLITRQNQIIEAAILSQNSINESNIRKRYAKYTKAPKLRQRILAADDSDALATVPISIAHIVAEPAPVKPPIFAVAKWVLATNPMNGEQEYVRLLQKDVDVVETIDEIDMSPYVLTTYQVHDYVLRRYPPSKIGGGNPHKYGSWWRGPYQITSIIQKPISETNTKPQYTIRNLTNDKEYVVDVTHLRPFYFDPDYVTPLNIAAKDTAEEVVEKIVNHDFSDYNDKRWLVRWAGNGQPEETWERYDNLKDVEAFQQYCAAHHLDPFPPKRVPKFSASAPNMLRTTAGSYMVPQPPDLPTSHNDEGTRRRGRPKKIV
jgi:hypothetical protein